MNKKGFTLIELLLYISILSMIILSLSAFFSITLESKVKNRTIAEVEQQGNFVMQNITQTIRNSSLINSPATGITGATLSLNVTDVAKTPTIYNLATDVLTIKEGAASAINLTSSKVAVSGPTFANLTAASTKGTIKVQFTITYKNNSGRNENDYAKTFYGTASLR